MLSDSRRERCVSELLVFIGKLTVHAKVDKIGDRTIPDGAELGIGKITVMCLIALAVGQRLAIHIKNTSTRGPKNSVSCSRVPLHRPPEAGIEIGFAFCNEAKLE